MELFIICAIYIQTIPQGSDGSGGSINGEMSDAACIIIAEALDLNVNDSLLDLFGSGGGITVARMAAKSGCAAVGIECEVDRINVAKILEN
jgi:hypothetical protein